MKAPLLSESTRTYVSLALFMHLFCVLAVLSGNFYPSSLQSRLSKTVGVYTQTLHLDPGWVPFQLTDAESGLADAYRWQIVETTANGSSRVVREFPGAEQPARGGFRRLRHEAFARLAASYAADEMLDDEVCATMARALARYYFSLQPLGGDAPSSTRLVVRCVSSDFVEDSALDATDAGDSSPAIYEADAWLSESGKLNVLKRMEARRTAPPVPVGDR